ncbi:MAG: polysaccharide biosynthesis/export family protein, partial [Planctomycetota bacterium]
MKGAGLQALLLLASLAGGCSSLEDKRVYQILNRAGFGRHYQGDATEENYAAVGDSVLVSDPLNAEFLTSPPQAVDIDGTIEMPEIGSVHVAGLTEGEIAALLTGLYRPYFQDMRITVRIRTQAKWFFVFG